MVKTPKILDDLVFRKKEEGKNTIFVSGSWHPEKATYLSKEAYKLGRLLAEEGFDLTIGPGTGIARYVIDGFRSIPGKGKIIFYLPKLSEMKRVGEEMEEGADEVIETSLDYPLRNLFQVKESDAVICIAGSAGSFTELIAAVLDYHKPAIILDRFSEANKAIRALPKIRDKVYFASTVEDIMKVLKEHLKLPPKDT